MHLWRKRCFSYDVGNSQTWKQLGLDWKIFGVKGPTFERMFVKYVNIVSEYLYNYLVETEARRFSHSDIEEKGKGCHYYPFAKYATDVTF